VKIAEVADFDHEAKLAKIVSLLNSCEKLDEVELVKKLSAIVPEFKSSNHLYVHDSNDSKEDSVELELYPD
jgi:hypothetical protein